MLETRFNTTSRSFSHSSQLLCQFTLVEKTLVKLSSVVGLSGTLFQWEVLSSPCHTHKIAPQYHSLALVWVWVFKGNLHWHNVMSNKVSKDCTKFIFWRYVIEKNSVRHILFITQGKSWINLYPNVDHASSNFPMKGIVCIVGCTVLQPIVVLDNISFQWRLCFIQFCSRAAKPLCTVSTSSDVLLFCSTGHFYDWGQNKRENIEACLTKSIKITAS